MNTTHSCCDFWLRKHPCIKVYWYWITRAPCEMLGGNTTKYFTLRNYFLVKFRQMDLVGTQIKCYCLKFLLHTVLVFEFCKKVIWCVIIVNFTIGWIVYLNCAKCKTWERCCIVNKWTQVEYQFSILIQLTKNRSSIYLLFNWCLIVFIQFINRMFNKLLIFLKSNTVANSGLKPGMVLKIYKELIQWLVK